MTTLKNPNKHGKCCCRKSLIFLLALSGCMVAGLILIASFRYPVAPTMGNYINPPEIWKKNDAKSFRVSTYNICRGKGLDGKRDLNRTASILKGNDIIGLNEVGGRGFWGTPIQAEQLGKMLGMGWLFASNQTRWFKNYFGNALLSRLKPAGWYSEQLIWSDKLKSGKLSSNSNRNLLTVFYRINGHDVYVLITHLDRGTIQGAQLNYILNKFRQYKYAILMGDLNTTGNNHQLRGLFENPKNVDAIKEALGKSNDKNRIDWIITRGFKILRGGSHPAGVSDHPNYWVDLTFMNSHAP